MLASERRNAIMKMIETESAVTTAKLMDLFNVSFETIRKDLLFLEKNKALIRVHGGAVSKNNIKPFYDFEKRIDDHKAEKRELSKLAASLVSENDMIGIDAGTTAIEFTEEIMARFHSLTIATYSMDVFERVNDYKNFSIILCGGNYMKKERTFYGVFANKILDSLHLSKSFIFPSAVSLKNGVCDYQAQVLELQQKLVENSGNVMILADSSKYEKNALYKVCDLNSRHIYVTDSALSENIKEIYKKNEYKIITREEDFNESITNFK